MLYAFVVNAMFALRKIDFIKMIKSISGKDLLLITCLALT